jgi:hypothetical protein
MYTYLFPMSKQISMKCGKKIQILDWEVFIHLGKYTYLFPMSKKLFIHREIQILDAEKYSHPT